MQLYIIDNIKDNNYYNRYNVEYVAGFFSETMENFRIEILSI